MNSQGKRHKIRDKLIEASEEPSELIAKVKMLEAIQSERTAQEFCEEISQLLKKYGIDPEKKILFGTERDNLVLTTNNVMNGMYRQCGIFGEEFGYDLLKSTGEEFLEHKKIRVIRFRPAYLKEIERGERPLTEGIPTTVFIKDKEIKLYTPIRDKYYIF